MAFRDFLGKIFSKDITEVDVIDEKFISEIYLKELAINSAINIIAKLMSSCEIKTYMNNKFICGHMYYLFNVEPNQNQNATQFYFDLFQKLVYDNEVLVFRENGYLYVAERSLYETYFKNVTLKDLTLTEKTYYMNDVLYLKLNNKKIKKLIDGLYNSYGTLISSAMDSYKKSKGIRGKYKISSNWSQKYKDQEELQKVIRSKFKSYFSSDNAVLPLEEGFDFIESNSDGTKKLIASSEITQLIDEVFNVVAVAFNMPIGVLKGDISQNKEIIKSLLTFNIKPYARMLENEINRKFYGEKEYIAGNRVRVDTKNVQYINIFENANALDVLFRMGFSYNEIMTRLDEEQLDEKWANEHFITKNYMNVQEMTSNGKEDKK